MKKILIPTDFSLCAVNAINFAIQSSRIFPIEVIVIYVVDLMNNVYSDSTNLTTDYSALIRQAAKEKLAKLKELIQIDENMSIMTTIYETPVGPNIVQAAIDSSADFIIMGTMGASGIKEKLWGTNTSTVIEKSRIPVMVIPHKYQWKKPGRILLASNSFEQDESVLGPVMDLVRLYEASLHIVVFTDKENDPALTVFEHARKISSHKDFIEQTYGHVAIADHIYGNDLNEALQDYIKANEIDLLVMTTHRRKLFGRLFHPSLTKRMSFHTEIPLLAIPS